MEWRQLRYQLMRWYETNPEDFNDGCVELPTKAHIEIFLDLIDYLEAKGYPEFSWVVPGPNGEIVLDRRLPDEDEVFHLWDDGQLEHMRFYKCKLFHREPFVFKD